MATSDSGGTVLVVDDEKEVADAYALRVEQEYEVRTAYGGEAALEAVGDDVDVVLLDRRMPDISGDEVLGEIDDRGYDCRVVMVTAVNPDFDILEMPFDDYLAKPVGPDALFETIEEQLEARSEGDATSELFSVTAKVGVLEQRKSEAELADNEQYQRLKARAAELREQVHGDDGTETTATETGADAGAAGAAGTDSATAGGPDVSESTADAEPAAAPSPEGDRGFGLTTTAAGFGVLLVVLLGGTFSSPMATSTKTMVAGGQVVALAVALALGVKYGEYRATH